MHEYILIVKGSAIRKLDGYMTKLAFDLAKEDIIDSVELSRATLMVDEGMKLREMNRRKGG